MVAKEEIIVCFFVAPTYERGGVRHRQHVANDRSKEHNC